MSWSYTVQQHDADGATAHFINEAVDALDTLLDLTEDNPFAKIDIEAERDKYLDALTKGEFTEDDPLGIQLPSGSWVTLYSTPDKD